MPATIELKEIPFFAFHGVYPEEQILGTHFKVSIRLQANIDKAFDTDAVADTINYQTIFELVKTEMEIPSKLIEHIIGRIANAIKTNTKFESLEIKMQKQIPMVKGLGWVEVSRVY